MKKKTNNKKENRLTKRDRLILQHIATYEMSTFEVIYQLFFENKKVDAVKSSLRRLGKNQLGVIESEKIPGSRKVYYRLTKDGAKLIGADHCKCERLGDSILPQRYAMLWFACFTGHDVQISVCRPREHPKLFSFGTNRLPKIDFYIVERKRKNNEKPDVSFGFTITDFNSHHRRIADRANKHLSRFLLHGWFDEIIKVGRFELTVFTATDEKKRAIDLLLNRELRRVLRGRLLKFAAMDPDLFPIKTQVVVIPGLAELIPGHSITKGQK